MSEALERAARAYCASVGANADAPVHKRVGFNLEPTGQLFWETYTPELSAALTAFLDHSEAEVEALARAVYIATSNNPDAAGRFDRAIEWALDEDCGELPAWIVDLKVEARALLLELSKMAGAHDER